MSPLSLPVAGVILCIFTRWPTEPRRRPNLYTAQSCTCVVADLVWHVCKWSPNTSIWKALQGHYRRVPIKSGIDTPSWEQSQTSQSARGKRSSLVRHLTWLRNPRCMFICNWIKIGEIRGSKNCHVETMMNTKVDKTVKKITHHVPLRQWSLQRKHAPIFKQRILNKPRESESTTEKRKLSQ